LAAFKLRARRRPGPGRCDHVGSRPGSAHPAWRGAVAARWKCYLRRSVWSGTLERSPTMRASRAGCPWRASHPSPGRRVSRFRGIPWSN